MLEGELAAIFSRLFDSALFSLFGYFNHYRWYIGMIATSKDSMSFEYKID
uniref:Uncharacterized protein n=1 Tax=Octopus bimaculoides TaxID=37653 RepID=A0A0L8FXC1_OCTBM